MKVIIDRFEDNIAVCEKEDKTMIDILKSKLPEGAKEGDVLILNDNTIILDFEETRKRKKEIEDLIQDLWE